MRGPGQSRTLSPGSLSERVPSSNCLLSLQDFPAHRSHWPLGPLWWFFEVTDWKARMDSYYPCWTRGYTEAGSADSRGSPSVSRHPSSTGSSPSVSGRSPAPWSLSLGEGRKPPRAPSPAPSVAAALPTPCLPQGQEAGADPPETIHGFPGRGGGGQGSEGRWPSVPPLSDVRAEGCGNLNQVPATLLPSWPGHLGGCCLSDLSFPV